MWQTGQKATTSARTRRVPGSGRGRHRRPGIEEDAPALAHSLDRQQREGGEEEQLGAGEADGHHRVPADELDGEAEQPVGDEEQVEQGARHPKAGPQPHQQAEQGQAEGGLVEHRGMQGHPEQALRAAGDPGRHLGGRGEAPGQRGGGADRFGEEAADAAYADAESHGGGEQVAGTAPVADDPLGDQRSQVGAGEAAHDALATVHQDPGDAEVPRVGHVPPGGGRLGEHRPSEQGPRGYRPGGPVALTAPPRLPGEDQHRGQHPQHQEELVGGDPPGTQTEQNRVHGALQRTGHDGGADSGADYQHGEDYQQSLGPAAGPSRVRGGGCRIRYVSSSFPDCSGQGRPNG